VQKVNAQTDSLLTKLREDSVVQRRQQKSRMFSELDEVRSRAATVMEGLQEERHKLLQTLQLERSNIDSIQKLHLGEGETDLDNREEKLHDLRDLLHSLQHSLVKEEACWMEAQQSALLEANRRREDKDTLMKQLERQMQEMKEANARQEQAAERRRKEADADFQSEFTRIQSKVATLLDKKSSTLQSLKTRWKELNERTISLNAVLDNVRANSFGA
jgi:DNA repair exonuclease SbcCD ATPase subunit